MYAIMTYIATLLPWSVSKGIPLVQVAAASLGVLPLAAPTLDATVLVAKLNSR